MYKTNYIQTVKYLKEEILKSRYYIAKVANRELLLLYFKVGFIISERVSKEKWGNKTIEVLSADLQNELRGLRGFSTSNLKNMRHFYEEWKPVLNTTKSSNEIGQLLTDQFGESFANIGFTAHIEIISKTKSIDARLFYITKTSQEFWSVRTLKHHLKNKFFEQQGQLPNNFSKTIKAPINKEKALKTFKDHYLLDFIKISDEEADNEKLLESKIVNNIKKFIMSLGADFAFLGNQYRLIVDDEEYFIDLLFFNRSLKALVAFELKTGKFKPEYLGKMNFYLSALDEYVKQKDENPSIGIILCKEKKNKIVEFAFRDFNKAMEVATYNTGNKLPPKYKNILPDADTLKKMMDLNDEN
ncbi:MAG: PDDEXK nuclease domain-containing protein [Melioribacteraceae bacterium]|nr:PDDEXK nuclease domain-containing protein [Melioribacteraceae bacterium]